MEDNTKEKTVLKFWNSLPYYLIWSFFWKKMAESTRLKCLLQSEDYNLSVLNVSLKYLSYFYLSYVYFTGTGDIKYAYTVQLLYGGAFLIYVCLSETKFPLLIFGTIHIYKAIFVYCGPY